MMVGGMVVDGGSVVVTPGFSVVTITHSVKASCAQVVNV